MNYELELQELDRLEIVAQIIEEIKERKMLLNGFLESQAEIKRNPSLQRMIITESVPVDTGNWLEISDHE